jgi:hypothetical protein
MALAALDWKRLATQTLGGSATVADTLDAIYTAFQATSYNNGDARSAGNVQAWTAARQQTGGGVTTAVYCFPASAASAVSRKSGVVFAGQDAASISNFPLFDMYNSGPATRKLGSETWNHDYLQNCLFVGHAMGVTNGASDYDGTGGAGSSATDSPFSTGGFTGYSRFGDEGFHGSGKVILYESLDAIAMIFVDGSSVQYETSLFIGGGILDPGSTDSADGEADYGRYGMSCSSTPTGGSFSTLGTGDGIFPYSGANNNQEVAVSWVPGSTTEFNVLYPGTIHKNRSPGSFNLPSGKAVKIPTYAIEKNNPYTFIGRFREVYMFQKANAANTVSVSSNIVGHTLADTLSPGTTQFSLLLDGSS